MPLTLSQPIRKGNEEISYILIIFRGSAGRLRKFDSAVSQRHRISVNRVGLGLRESHEFKLIRSPGHYLSPETIRIRSLM